MRKLLSCNPAGKKPGKMNNWWREMDGFPSAESRSNCESYYLEWRVRCELSAAPPGAFLSLLAPRLQPLSSSVLFLFPWLSFRSLFKSFFFSFLSVRKLFFLFSIRWHEFMETTYDSVVTPAESSGGLVRLQTSCYTPLRMWKSESTIRFLWWLPAANSSPENSDFTQLSAKDCVFLFFVFCIGK